MLRARMLCGFLLITLVPTGSLGDESKTPATPIAVKKKPIAPVAVLDIQAVFSRCTSFQRSLTQMKQEVASFDKQVRARRAALEKKTKELIDLDSESVEFVELERRLATAHAQLKIDMEQKRKALLKDEASLYASTYRKIQRAVAEYCRERGIRLVMRYDSTKMDVTKRETVLKSVNRNVIWQDDLNITEAVVKILNDSDRVAKAG